MSTAAYQSPSELQSGNFAGSREIRTPQKFLALIDRLGIPLNIRTSFKGYYEACGSPIGPNPAFWKGLRKVAREIGMSYRTLKRHHRKYLEFNLIHNTGGPNSDRRSKTWGVNTPQFYEQQWPGGICPRCRHKHTGAECGCELSPRHWPTKGWVERRCRCTPRPSEISARMGPQRTENPSRPSPESPTTQPGAAPSQPSPAAPAREIHRTVRQMEPRPLRSGETRNLGQLYQQMLLLMQEHPPPEQALAKLGADLRYSHEDTELKAKNSPSHFRHHLQDFWRHWVSQALNGSCKHVDAHLVVSAIEQLSQEIRHHGLHEDELANYQMDRVPLKVPRSRREAVEIICRRLNMNFELAIEHLRGARHEIPDEEESP